MLLMIICYGLIVWKTISGISSLLRQLPKPLTWYYRAKADPEEIAQACNRYLARLNLAVLIERN